MSDEYVSPTPFSSWQRVTSAPQQSDHLASARNAVTSTPTPEQVDLTTTFPNQPTQSPLPTFTPVRRNPDGSNPDTTSATLLSAIDTKSEPMSQSHHKPQVSWTTTSDTFQTFQSASEQLQRSQRSGPAVVYQVGVPVVVHADSGTRFVTQEMAELPPVYTRG